MIEMKLSGVAVTAAPLKTSWHDMGIVTPEILLDVLDIVQNTAVLIAAVALELAFWAKAPTPDNASAATKQTHFDRVLLQVVNAALLRTCADGFAPLRFFQSESQFRQRQSSQRNRARQKSTLGTVGAFLSEFNNRFNEGFVRYSLPRRWHGTWVSAPSQR